MNWGIIGPGMIASRFAGVYPIEFAIGVLDELPQEVTGVAHFCVTGVDDQVAMSLSFPSGALAVLSCGLRANTSATVKISGTEGSIIVDDFLRSKHCELYDKKGNVCETFAVEVEDGFSYQIQHFAALLAEGKIESPLMPLRDTIACAGVFDTLMTKCGIGSIGFSEKITNIP